MIVRVTGSFAKQIGVTVTATLPLCENPVADWTCRVFSLREGEPVLLVANTTTLYSMLIPAVGLERLEQFQGGLNICLERRLLADGFEAIIDRRLGPEIKTISLAKSLNRSVTGSMNDMVRLATFMLTEEGRTFEQATVKLNETPFGALDYAHPRKRFAELASWGCTIDTDRGRNHHDPFIAKDRQLLQRRVFRR